MHRKTIPRTALWAIKLLDLLQDLFTELTGGSVVPPSGPHWDPTTVMPFLNAEVCKTIGRSCCERMVSWGLASFCYFSLEVADISSGMKDQARNLDWHEGCKKVEPRRWNGNGQQHFRPIAPYQIFYINGLRDACDGVIFDQVLAFTKTVRPKKSSSNGLLSCLNWKSDQGLKRMRLLNFPTAVPESYILLLLQEMVLAVDSILYLQSDRVSPSNPTIILVPNCKDTSGYIGLGLVRALSNSFPGRARLLLILLDGTFQISWSHYYEYVFKSWQTRFQRNSFPYKAKIYCCFREV